MSKARDTIRDHIPGAEASEAAVAQLAPVPAAPVDLTSVLTELARAQARAAEAQAQLTLAVAGIAGDRERIIHDERDEIDRQKVIRSRCEKSNAQTTQENADKKWPAGKGRFKVALMASVFVPDPVHPSRRRKMQAPAAGHPVVDLNADSVEEARERYRVLCGINGTEHEVRATPIETNAGHDADVERTQLDEWAQEEARRAGNRGGLVSAGVQEI